MTPASSRSAISSGQRTEPGSQTRERSLRSRSTIITCSAASFSPSTCSPSGRVPLIGLVQTRRPRRARKSSGEAETIAQPSPASVRGAEGGEARGERGRVAVEARQVLDEIDLVDVAAPDRGAHRLDRVGVVRVAPASAPTRSDRRGRVLEAQLLDAGGRAQPQRQRAGSGGIGERAAQRADPYPR